MFKKYAIIEYENYSGNYTPIIVVIGKWHKLIWILMDWSKQNPPYAESDFDFIDAKAEHIYAYRRGVFPKHSTVRKIVEVGKDWETSKFVEHLKIGRWI